MVLRVRLFIAYFTLVGILGCNEGEEPNSIKLIAEKLSDTQMLLNWNTIKGNRSFDIWRMMLDNGQTSGLKLIATVDSLTKSYVDESFPQTNMLIYFVTSSVGNEEKKSNEVTVKGASALYFTPYQMKLIPEKDLAVIRGYNEIILLDYSQKAILMRKEFPGKIGVIDFGKFNSSDELYVPCSDNKVYICNPLDLTVKEVLNVNYPAYAVAINSFGDIFVSVGSPSSTLKRLKRNPLSLVNEYDGTVSGIYLQSDNRLLAVNSHLMSFYNFSDNGLLISKVNYPYSHDLESDRTRLSSHFVVSSSLGRVYTADDNMNQITMLNSESYLSDFEFSEDGKTIFSAITNVPSIKKSIISGNQVTWSLIRTKGYPWILARDANELVVLSSPNSFSPYATYGEVIIEKVSID